MCTVDYIRYFYQYSHCIILEVFYFQMVKLFMFSPVSGLYSCPLAMTDGAAKTIKVNILKM